MDAASAAQRCAQRRSQTRVAGGEHAQQRWERTIGRAAQIIEPLWPEGYSAGPFSHVIPVLAASGYQLLPDADPDQVSQEDLLSVLRGPSPGVRLSVALAKRGEADALDELISSLRTKPEFVDTPFEAPSMWAPDFREPLAGIVEWTIAALERSVAAETAA